MGKPTRDTSDESKEDEGWEQVFRYTGTDRRTMSDGPLHSHDPHSHTARPPPSHTTITMDDESKTEPRTPTDRGMMGSLIKPMVMYFVSSQDVKSALITDALSHATIGPYNEPRDVMPLNFKKSSKHLYIADVTDGCRSAYTWMFRAGDRKSTSLHGDDWSFRRRLCELPDLPSSVGNVAKQKDINPGIQTVHSNVYMGNQFVGTVIAVVLPRPVCFRKMGRYNVNIDHDKYALDGTWPDELKAILKLCPPSMSVHELASRWFEMWRQLDDFVPNGC